MSERRRKFEQRELIRKHVKSKGTMVDEVYASQEADRMQAQQSGISSSYGKLEARLKKGRGREKTHRRRRTRRKSRRKSSKNRRKSSKKRKSRRRRRR
jgi:hypothetical protein